MSHAAIETIARVLLHFIWQGAAIALVAGIADATLRRARPAARYALFCGALALMALAPVVTLAMLRLPPAESALVAAAATAVTSPPTAAVPTFTAAGQLWPAWLVGLWLAGVVILGVRSLGGWIQAMRLTRWKTSPAAESIQRAALRLCERLDIRRRVRVLSSAAAELPAAVGWIRPVVLLPVGALTTLTPEQIELLLAHELAHVRRHDYLVNLIQAAVETVLFYHPAVWWVSGRIRAEREHCCDDLAVAACGNPVTYARALAALEGQRTRPPGLVVAADGGSLLARIRRLSSGERNQRATPPAWLGALLPAAVLLAAVVSVPPPDAIAVDATDPPREAEGFLGGLTQAGYTNVSVDEIIALNDNAVEPRYIKGMLAAGLGTPDVEQLIRLRNHGVEPGFVAAAASSGLVGDLDFQTVIRLRENDVRPDDLGRVRALGFGPYSADEVIKLRQNGVDATTFATLKEIGIEHPGVAEAIEVRENDITVERIRAMRSQGFDHLSLGQIVKLRRAGII